MRAGSSAEPGTHGDGRAASRRSTLAVAGLLEVAALAAMGWIPGLDGTPLPAFALWGAAWAAHLWGWRTLETGIGGGATPSRRAIVWTVGIAGRLALLPLLPHFSEDLWRYLWDGHVALGGVNPYLHAPSDPVLDTLATAWRGRINHPAVSTIYPPGAQLVFTALGALGSSAVLYKAAWVAADLGVAALLDRLARLRGDASGRTLLLWLWSPLVLVEVAWSGHLEPLGLLPVVGGLLVLERRARETSGPGPDHARSRDGRGLLAGGLLGLGAAVKFAPLAVLPALARRRGWRAAAVGLAVPLLLYLPYSSAGADLFAGLGEYASRWRFDAALFPLLEALLGGGARVGAALLVAGVALLAALRRWSVDRALLWTVGAALLLSPTIHPWYALWALPFALLRRAWPWVLWTALLFLAYAGRDVYAATGVWPHPLALAALIHVPLLVLLAADGLRAAGLLRRTPP